MRTHRLVIGWVLAVLAARLCGAAPIPRLGPMDITGKIVSAKWVAEQQVKGVPGMSGSAGRDRVNPAHFIVVLEGVQGADPRALRQMSRYLGSASGAAGEECADPPCAVLKLNHADPEYLKPGMHIIVKEYRIGGDEGGTWTSFSRIAIALNGEADQP